MKILYNNQFKNRDEVVIDIEDRGYQFGDGIYEVMRVYNGNVFTLDEHLERLIRSAAELKIQLPYRVEDIKTMLLELVEQNHLEEGSIYVQITRGTSMRNHPFPAQSVPPVLIAYPLPKKNPSQEQQQGVKLKLIEDMRWLRCDIKSLNLLYNVMAKQEALDHQCYEALLHRNGTITEGSSTNFFAVKEGKLYTHPANNLILNGITRVEIKKLCEANGMTMIEKELMINEIESFDEAFITSTTLEIVPVIQIDEMVIGQGEPGKMTKRLQVLFQTLV